MNTEVGMSVPMWKVTAVEDYPGPTSFGGQSRIKRVHYRMANNDESYVEVADRPGWPAQAEQEIEQAVQNHMIALGLESRTMV